MGSGFESQGGHRSRRPRLRAFLRLSRRDDVARDILDDNGIDAGGGSRTSTKGQRGPHWSSSSWRYVHLIGMASHGQPLVTRASRTEGGPSPPKAADEPKSPAFSHLGFLTCWSRGRHVSKRHISLRRPTTMWTALHLTVGPSAGSHQCPTRHSRNGSLAGVAFRHRCQTCAKLPPGINAWHQRLRVIAISGTTTASGLTDFLD